MEIKRDLYLKKLISFMWDGQVKVITGIRRCGKSYLLRTIFRNYLLEQGVSDDRILTYELDLAKDIQFRNPLELARVVREKVEGQPDRFLASFLVATVHTQDRVQIRQPGVTLQTQEILTQVWTAEHVKKDCN